MKIAIISFTRNGAALGSLLADSLNADCSHASTPRFAHELNLPSFGSLAEWTRSNFDSADALVFVSASGIAVRAVAPLLKSKSSDPAIVAVDEAGQFAVPLASGHIGGANHLARSIASITGGTPVISTATDVRGVFAVDEWAVANNLAISDLKLAKLISATILDGNLVQLVSDFPCFGSLPVGLSLDSQPVAIYVTLRADPLALGCAPPRSLPDYIISPNTSSAPVRRYPDSHSPMQIVNNSAADFTAATQILALYPKILSLGIGCRKSTPAKAIAAAVKFTLDSHNLPLTAVAGINTISIKADEPGLLEFCYSLGISLKSFSASQLNDVQGSFTPSQFVKNVTGVDNVCERAAAFDGCSVIVPKHSLDGVTVAVAIPNFILNFPEVSL